MNQWVERFKKIPFPLFISGWICILSFIFGTSLTEIDFWRRGVFSTMLGGLSWWFWILEKVLEKQSIRPYTRRPPSRELVLDWWDKSKLPDYEEKGLSIGFVTYMFLIIIAVYFLGTFDQSSSLKLFSALAISVFTTLGFLVPAYYIIGSSNE